MGKTAKFGDRRVIIARRRTLAKKMIADKIDICADYIRWLSGPVSIGSQELYVGTFENVATGDLWRFTYRHGEKKQCIVERMQFDT